MENRQWIYAARPSGRLGPEHFRLQAGPRPALEPGEVLVRVKALSIDPAQRIWMAGPSYRPMLQPGTVMASYAVGEVAESKSPEFAVGDSVEGDLGWQDFAALSAGALRKREKARTIEQNLGVLGMTGRTAFIGLFDFGRPLAGETVLVTGAAGAVGSVAVQIARLQGCRVVAVAGGAAKCAWLRELGADAAIDYKADSFRADLRGALPDGIDVFFDNVGGQVLEMALPMMRKHGRIVCCGAVSSYDQNDIPPGPRGVPALLISRRLRMEGFVVLDHADRYAVAEEKLGQWLDSGALTAPVHVVEGFEQAPAALMSLLGGANFGKMLVRVT